MGVRLGLKGINWVRRKLADGTVKDYPYLGRGRGALRLEGGRDSEEARQRLVASYTEARKRHREPEPNTLKGIITAYMLSPAFTRLRERTRASYQKSFARSRTPLGTSLSPRLTTHE